MEGFIRGVVDLDPTCELNSLGFWESSLVFALDEVVGTFFFFGADEQ
jgi:hypothetical protein